jgi:LPS-assembly protein
VRALTLAGLALAGLVPARPAVAAPPSDLQGYNLKLSPELARRSSDESGLPVYFRAARVEGTPERELKLEGTPSEPAELRRGSVVLKADRIQYVQSGDLLEAAGQVRLQRDGDHYEGPTLEYHLDSERGQLGAGSYLLATGGRGTAERTNFRNRDTIDMREVRYTTCQPGDDSWYLSARRIEIDQFEGEGTASQAVLYFKDVPIFATPYFGFAVGEQRKTGFLTPSLDLSTARGVEVSLPYYFNIAPDRDYTLTANYNVKRGLLLGNEGRYLGQKYKGETRFDYAPDDRVYGSKRWSLASFHNQDLGRGFSGYWNISRMSDNNYLADYSRTIVGVANRQLTQEIGFSYAQSNWNALLRVQDFQVLQDAAAPIAQPYEREPQLVVKAFQYDVHGLDLTLDTDFSRFTSKQPGAVRGDRWVAVPTVSYPMIGPALYVTPRMSMNMAQYALDEKTIPISSGYDKNYSRAIPTLSVDSGVVYERDASYFSKDYLQTLEPRLFYVRTPYHKQTGAPIFDSAQADFNFAQLFSENVFAGQDRISDANQVTAAVSTRLIEPSTGEEKFRVLLGERLYLDNTRVGLTNETVNTARRSDFLLGAGGNVLPGLYADSLVQYDAAAGRPFKANMGVKWAYDQARVASVEYRYIRKELEQYDFAGQWRLSNQWVGVARVNYSTFEHRLVEGLVGLEYQACCWVARLVAQRFVTATNTANTTFFVQLELNGFASIGTSPVDALKRSVPGYQLINAPTGSPSRFERYE